ncbi:MAG: hypothetical protein IJ711_09240 [Lachnospiraceae bacterium]|nr:hypothetical protein [Lachnospiraceae bacterium]
MDEYMPSDLQYKDDLRKQRDNWDYVIRQLRKSVGFGTDQNIQSAFERASQELTRINESLQD